jgi:predicted DNA-binding transcriptional regulator AlpA
MQEARVFLRAKDLEHVLGLSRARIYGLAKAGGLPCIKRGRAVLFPARSFAIWLQDRERDALASVREC